MLPALPRGIIAATRGEQMEMGMVLPSAAMCVEHRDIAPSERLAPDSTLKIIQALGPAAHERAQHDRRVLVKSGTEHLGHRQDNVPRDHPRVEDLAYLIDTG
jgi:hypothetical protein